jgi:hypothetical protein
MFDDLARSRFAATPPRPGRFFRSVSALRSVNLGGALFALLVGTLGCGGPERGTLGATAEVVEPTERAERDSSWTPGAEPALGEDVQTLRAARSKWGWGASPRHWLPQRPRWAVPYGHGGHHKPSLPKPPKPPEPAADPCAGGLVFQEIVISGVGGSMALSSAALNNRGQVLVAGEVAGAPSLLLGDGATVSAVDLTAQGFTELSKVGLDDAGDLVFTASPAGAASGSSGSLFGVFVTDAAGSAAQSLYDASVGGGLGDGGELFTFSRLAVAANGTVAFSSIRNGVGGLYRSPIAGPPEALVANSPPFFNSQDVDVNAAGVVTLQMEHSACGLQRGVLVFDSPGTTMATVRKAVAGFGVGQQPDASLNDAGEIAFALEGTGSAEVLRCPAGEPAERFSLDAGVYTAQPTPLSDRPNIALVADTAGAFASFEAVEFNNARSVVFQATLDSGEVGIFRGPDTTADKVLVVGDTLGGEQVEALQLGQLNDRCQLALVTDGPSGPRVWRVSGIAP